MKNLPQLSKPALPPFRDYHLLWTTFVQRWTDHINKKMKEMRRSRKKKNQPVMTRLYMGLGPRSSYINSPIRRKRLKNIYRPESFPIQWKYFWFNIHVLIFKKICCNGMIFGYSLNVNKPRAITLRVYSILLYEGFCKRNILTNSDILLVIAASHLIYLNKVTANLILTILTCRATGFADMQICHVF